MSSHKKRERTQNWTQEEKILLLKLCGGRISILENKKADQYSLTIKNNVWKDIHSEFIAQLGTDRDILRLKEQWQRMKKQARSELQDLRTRSKKHGEHLSQFKKISNISEEVLKMMDIAASKSNQEEEDGSYTSSESSVEQDNIPTYFCETEVKQEQEDSRTRIFTMEEEDSQQCFTRTTTTASVINSNNNNNNNNSAQPKSKYNNRRDTILNILADICQNENTVPTADAIRKRKHDSDSDEFQCQFLQTLFQSKNKEHQKRMHIIEEQLKTAKIQRETAEIQKQIAQQELKHTLYQISSSSVQCSKEKRITNITNSSTSDIVNTEIRNETANFQRLNFHQSQIHFHEEEIEKHRQQIEDMVKREHGCDDA